ncbi:MAG: hypothetical protein QHJ34_10765 [bacterium]|jgi:hypothetical protein|nr:hypothetical protein [candidate division KSB1 bacterium]MDH7560695.1 hypothetical protein [bacterium]
MKNNNALPEGIKLLTLHLLFNGRALSPLVDQLDDHQVVALQRFVWDTTVEFGIKAKGKAFSHQDITRRMVPSAVYQKEQGCTEPSFACKASHCIRQHRECARRKLKGQLDVIAALVKEYLKSGSEV